MEENRKRILQMLADGKITADEADTLLSALGSSEQRAEPTEPTRDMVVKGTQGRKATKLRVEIKANDVDEKMKKANVNVSVPIGLARKLFPIVKNNIPPSAQVELDKQNINLAEIFGGVEELLESFEVGEDIVNIDAGGDLNNSDMSAKVRVYFE